MDSVQALAKQRQAAESKRNIQRQAAELREQWLDAWNQLAAFAKWLEVPTGAKPGKHFQKGESLIRTVAKVLEESDQAKHLVAVANCAHTAGDDEPGMLFIVELLQSALDSAIRKGEIAKRWQWAFGEAWPGCESLAFPDVRSLSDEVTQVQRELEGFDANAKAEPSATEQPQDNGKITSTGIAPRDAWFVTQYEARGTDTYHKPAKIFAKWDAMTATARAEICPDSPNKIAQGTVASAIKRAIEARDNKEPTKPRRSPRKRA